MRRWLAAVVVVAWAACHTAEPTAACGANDAVSCVADLEAALAGEDREVLALARQRLADACERLEHAPACETLGRSLLRRGGDQTDAAEASGAGSAFGRGARLLERACALGAGDACQELGEITMRGVGVPHDLAKARPWFDKACALDVAAGCVDAGILAERGKGGGADPVRAMALFDKACRARDGRGCTKLGLALRDGLGGTVDGPGGVARLEEGCALGFAPGCGLAALAWERGEGVTPDPDRRLRFLVRAVALDDEVASRSLSALLTEDAQGARALVAAELTEPCARGVARACGAAGLASALSGAPDGGRGALTRACEGGDLVACGHLAEQGEQAIRAAGGEEALAVLHTRGCEGGHAASCLWMAEAYRTGRGVELPDPIAEAAARRRACELGLAEACSPSGVPSDGAGSED